MHRRTSRLNHALLIITGLVLTATGAYLITRHYDLLGHSQPAGAALYSPAETHWLHRHNWIWLTVAAVTILIGLVALRWLLVQSRLDRVRHLRVDRDLHAAGRTRMATEVLTDAIEDDIDGYPGVSKVRVMLTGAVDAPEIMLRVQAHPLADLETAYRRIVDEALPAARSALDDPETPAQIHLIIGGRRAD